MLLFCQSCGAECAPTYRFCPRCGGANLANTQPGPVASSAAIASAGISPTVAVTVQPHVANPISVTAMRYAGFWRRLLAYVLDHVVLLAAAFLVGLVIAILGLASTLDSNGVDVLFNIFGVVAAWLYFALQESGTHQATLGKRALGLKVFDMQGQRLTFGKATGRHFGKILSALILCIGFFMAAFTERKQALHDQLAGTVVLSRGE